MKSTKTKALLIFSIFLDLFFVAIFISLFIFTKNQISDTVNLTDQIKTEIKREQTLSLMKKDIEDSKSYEDKLYGYFIGKDNVADFLKILDDLVLMSSLQSEIKSVVYEPYDKTTLINIELVRVNMNIEGEWKNIQFFLGLLENYPLKINIKNILINKSSDFVVLGRKISKWSANIDFTVLKLKNI